MGDSNKEKALMLIANYNERRRVTSRYNNGLKPWLESLYSCDVSNEVMFLILI